MGRGRLRAAVIAMAMGVLSGTTARADSARNFSFAYDQPHSTGYGVAADLFNSKLIEMSHGSMEIDQFPGAQLGQEPQMLQKIRTGDIDFHDQLDRHAATVAPESGVLSIHWPSSPPSDDQPIKAIHATFVWSRRCARCSTRWPRTDTALALATLGLRDLYGKRPVASTATQSASRVRVQRT